MDGLIPISIYPRWNFLILAANQMVNHLDKISRLGKGKFKQKIIIRTSIGSKRPLHPNHQHVGDFTKEFKSLCKNIDFIKLKEAKDIFPSYKKALLRKDNKPTVLIEYGDFYNENKLNLLILGGSGFIGKNLVNYYKKKKEYNVFATYLNSKVTFEKKVKWIKVDLRKPNTVNKITKNKDIIIQAAATTSGSKDIINKPYIHVTDNALMNSVLLRSCFENKIKHLIFFSCTVMYKSSKTS